MSGGFGDGYDASVVRGLADSTLEGYKRRLLRLAREIRTGEDLQPRAAMEKHMLAAIRTEQSTQGLRKLLSGLRLLEKLEWVQPLVRKGDWMLVEGMERRLDKQQQQRNKLWASMDVIRTLCTLAKTAQD